MMPTHSSTPTDLQEGPRVSLPFGPPKVTTRQAATSAASSDAVRSSQSTAMGRVTGEKEAAPTRGQATRPGDANVSQNTRDLPRRNQWSAGASRQRPSMDEDEDEDKENEELSANDEEDNEERPQSSKHLGGDSDDDGDYTPRAGQEDDDEDDSDSDASCAKHQGSKVMYASGY